MEEEFNNFQYIIAAKGYFLTGINNMMIFCTWQASVKHFNKSYTLGLIFLIRFVIC